MGKYSKNKYYFALVFLSIILLANLFFTYLPLLNILSYESSSINGIILAFVSGIYWLKYNRVVSLKSISLFYILLAVIPFAILLLSTVTCQSCPVSDGILFYLVLSIPSIIVGIAIASFTQFISNKFKYFLFAIIYLIVLLGFLPELYFNPQIYFYNPIFGYFPGVIYDQNIEITKELFYYRIITVVISIILISVFRKNYNFKSITKLIVIIGVIIVYLSLSELKSTFSFNTELPNIKNELTSEISTEHFNIISSDNLSEREKKLLELNHEFYYNEISELLNVEIDKKVFSIIFKSGAQKKRLFGAENADVTKPWLNHIYTDFDNYKHTLKHELAHIFSAKFAGGYFKLPSNYNPGLVEGFAMAIENNFDDYNIHYFAALAYQNNYKISLEQLFGDLSFFANASSLSYIYAGSFVKYLAENFGWSKVTELYSTTDFNKTFNTDLKQLESNYSSYLTKLEIPKNINKANYYFGRKPLIKKFCARASAKELKKSWEFYKEKKYKISADKFLKIYKYSDSFSALLGYSKSQEKIGSIDKAIEILEEEKSNFKGTAYFYSMEYMLAELYLKNNNGSLFFLYTDSLIYQNPSTRLKRNTNVLKGLCMWNKELAIRYLEFPKKRINIIENYLSNVFSEVILQKLILLNIGRKINYDLVLGKIKNIIGDKKINSYTNFLLGKLAFENLDFARSIRFCNKSLENITKYRIEVVDDLKRKAVWSMKNRDNFN